MKLTIVGDPHIKNKNLEQANELFDLIESYGNPVVLLGDLLDTKEVIRGKSLNLLYKRLQRSKLNFTILIGNHDYFNLECQDHSLKVLESLPNVELVDDVVNKYGIYFIPYRHGSDNTLELLNRIPDNSIVFGHMDVISFDYGNGYISDSGLSIEDLSRFKKVISGHYHKPQSKDNLTYLGTPFSHSFGESNQDKYIGIFDTELHVLELIETPFPKHITKEINCDEDSSMEIYKDKDHVRLILKGTSENILKWKSNSSIPEGVKIVERPTDEFMNGIEIDETADNNVKFQEWANNIKQLDLETIKIGLSILESVK